MRRMHAQLSGQRRSPFDMPQGKDRTAACDEEAVLERFILCSPYQRRQGGARPALLCNGHAYCLRVTRCVRQKWRIALMT